MQVQKVIVTINIYKYFKKDISEPKRPWIL